MEFDVHGKLTYAIDLGDRLQIFDVTYQVKGNTIAIDQQSDLRMQVTRFRIGSDGLLELEKDGARSWYERVASNTALQRTHRPRIRSGRSLRSLGSRFTRRPLADRRR